MSNFPLVNPHSPQNRKNPFAAQGLVSPQTHLIGLPPSIKGVHKQSNSNHYAYRHGQPPPWGENIDLKQRDVSPIRHNFQEEKHIIPAQYNFQNVITQKRDSIGVANVRAEKSPQQVRLSRDISPLGRHNMQNEGVDYPQRAVRGEDRGLKGGERDNSWNKLINRSQEQALARNQKLFEWKRVLDDQIVERQKKKHQEEEKRKNEEAEAEERYQRQIEELSNEIHKRKKTLHKNGLLRQQSNVLPIANASPISHPNPNVNNINTKSHKELRLNRENLVQLNNPSPIPMKNIVRERRGKSQHREESFIQVNHSAEKQDYRPRNDLNQYIDSIKAEILQGQEVFRNHMKDLKDEAYKLGKFRNLAERNLLGAQRIGFVKSGAASMPSNLVFKEIYGADETVTPVALVEATHKPRKIKISVQEEEKFKWEADDFYSKLPATKNKNKQLLSGVQTMVRIEPVTEALMAYKKPKSPQKKWFEDEENQPEKEESEKAKKETKPQEKKQEEKPLPKENKDNEDKLKSGGFKKLDLDSSIKENKVTPTPAKKVEEENKAISSTTSLLEIKSIPKIISEPIKKEDGDDRQLRRSSIQKDIELKSGTQISITTPKNGDKASQEDYLQITKNFQPLAVMLNESNMPHDRDITPSIEQQGSRRNQTQTEKISGEKSSEKGTVILNTNEDMTEREVVQKTKDPLPVQKEPKISGNKNKQAKNLGLKSEVALKALSKFVSKDGLEAKIAGDKNLQSDPLARLDYMIDYLFNYNP